jgi:hypothetical protein
MLGDSPRERFQRLFLPDPGASRIEIPFRVVRYGRRVIVEDASRPPPSFFDIYHRALVQRLEAFDAFAAELRGHDVFLWRALASCRLHHGRGAKSFERALRCDAHDLYDLYLAVGLSDAEVSPEQRTEIHDDFRTILASVFPGSADPLAHDLTDPTKVSPQVLHALDAVCGGSALLAPYLLHTTLHVATCELDEALAKLGLTP